MTSTDIWKERLTIDKARRAKMKEAMEAYDIEVYYPARKALRLRCEKETGHNWVFRDTNPIGYPIFDCTICGATEIRPDDQ
jgi:hypothetical protein